MAAMAVSNCISGKIQMIYTTHMYFLHNKSVTSLRPEQTNYWITKRKYTLTLEKSTKYNRGFVSLNKIKICLQNICKKWNNVTLHLIHIKKRTLFSAIAHDGRQYVRIYVTDLEKSEKTAWLLEKNRISFFKCAQPITNKWIDHRVTSKMWSNYYRSRQCL